MCWHPSQFIDMFMGDIDTPLNKQPSKMITSILATQYTKDVLWVDEWKLTHFLILPWIVCDAPWGPIIHTYVDTPLNSSMDACVRLFHYCTINKARDHIHTGHTSSKGCKMCGWIKTGALSPSALDGGWYTISSNHLYRSWSPSQFINVLMCEVVSPLYR